MDFGYRQSCNDWLFRQKCRDFMNWQNSKQREKVSASSYDVTASVPNVNDIIVYRVKNGSHTERNLSGKDSPWKKNEMNHPAARPNTARNPFRINDSRVENAIRDKTRSIYQVDYLGAPQGVNLRTAFFDVSDLNASGEKPSPPKTLDTNSRISYLRPKKQPASLRPQTTRFECNPGFHIPALGVVPLISEGDVDLSSLGERGARTTYSREYNHKRPFTAPGSRFGNRPDHKPIPNVSLVLNSTDYVDENGVLLNKEEIFKRARSARVNESLTYRKPLKPTIISIQEPFSQWSGPE